MYSIGKKYKFELKKGIFYTGIVLEEDSTHIRVKSIRDEDLILLKDTIEQSKKMDSIEGTDGKNI